MLLAGDIGGTKTNLAVFAPDIGSAAPLAEASFPSGQYASLEAVVGDFLKQVHVPIEHACFGVAGPVSEGQATITNLPWMLDERSLAETFHWSSVRLLNDLEATAYAIPNLQPHDLATLNTGTPVAHGALAVIAPGTGLGEAFLVWDGARYQAYPSEGGHADFAPTSPFELDLLRYLLGQFGHVSYERVCSGRGLPNIYAYLRDTAFAAESPWVVEQLAAASDLAPVIVGAALHAEHPCGLCVATLDAFVGILGAQAGNLALTLLATGGVYLGGGIPPRILPVLESGRFMQAFLHKGRFGALLAQVPVHVIRNPKAALLGAASYGLAHQAYFEGVAHST